jgi:hypothetical protein
LLSALLLALQACGRQDALLGESGPTKPPSSISLEKGNSFVAADPGETSTAKLTLSVRGGHVPKIISMELASPFSWLGGSFPGTGGTCNAQGLLDECTVALAYKPTDPGVHSTTLRINYERSASSRLTWTKPLTASTPATLSITSPSAIDFGTSYVGQDVMPQSITLQHLHGGAASKIAFLSGAQKLEFAGSGIYPGSGGTCGATLSSGSCSLAISVVPEATGSFLQPLTIEYEDGKSTKSLSLTARGQVYYPPDLQLGPATQDLGEVFVRGTATIPLTVTFSKGDVPALGLAFLGILDDMGFPGGKYPGGGTCDTQLDPNAQTCTLNLFVSPTKVGRQTRTITLLYRSGNLWKYAPVTFTFNAIPPAELQSTPSTIQFGNVATGLSSTRTFTITHVSGQPPATRIRSTVPSSFSFSGGSYPGTGGTCSDRVEVGASCTLVMGFSPVTRGTYSRELVLTYFDGVGDSQLKIPMEGTTQAALQLALSAQTPTGSVVTGATATRTLTVTHAGGTTATNLAISSDNGLFSINPGTCGNSMSSGTCTYSITFTPTSTGSFSSRLNLAFNNGFSSDSTSLTVTGAALLAPQLTANPVSVDFGELVTTGTYYRSITLTAPASAGVAATSLSITGISSAFSIYSVPATQLTPGQSSTFSIRAQPSTRGTFNGTVTLSYFDGAKNQNRLVPITMSAIQAASLTFNATTSLDFGSVAVGSQSLPKTFEIRHSLGDADASFGLSLASGFIFEGGNFPGVTGTCPTTKILKKGESCLVSIVFAPTGPGNFGGGFVTTLSYYNGASSQYTWPALVGKSNGKVTPSGTSLGTKLTGTTSTVTLSASYSGYSPVTQMVGRIIDPSGVFSFAGGSYPGRNGTCTSTLSSGSCSFVVSFTPTNPTNYTATIALDYESGAGPLTTTAQLTGSGSGASTLQLSGTGAISGLQLVNSSTDINFTLTNPAGGLTAVSITATPLSAPYAFKGGTYPGVGGTCGTTLSGNSACRIVLAFKPTTAGTFNGQLMVSYFNGTNTAQASQNLSGAGGNPASLMSSTNSVNFGLVAPGQSSTLSLTFTNAAQTVPATNFTIEAVSSPFSIASQTCTSLPTGLSASSSCGIALKFSPATSGRYSTNLRLTYNDGAAIQSIVIPATGRTPTEYQLTPASNWDISERAVGGTYSFTYTLTRIGGPDSTELRGSILSSQGDSTFSFTGGSFPGTGATCTNPLTTDSCTINVTFKLIGLGNFSGSWGIVGTTGMSDANLSRTLGGISKTPATLELSDSSLSFPSTPVGSPSQLAIVIANSGGMTLASLIGSVSGAPADVFKFSGGTFPGLGGSCKSTLKGGDSCTAVLEFNPPDKAIYTAAANFQGFNGLTTIGPYTATLSHAATTGSAKPAIRMSQARRWGIPDVDGDGLWDILWLESVDSEVMLIIGSSTGGEIGRLSRDEAEGLIPH